MSAWPIPDEVVQQMATAIDDAFDCHEDPANLIRALLEAHRLVQLPEEPVEWEAEIARDGWYTYGPTENRMGAERLAADFRATGRIRPVYRIPGQPITVDKEESEAPGGAS